MLALPDLVPWVGSDRAPDIHIRLGAVPGRLGDVVHGNAFLQIAGDGTCRFEVPAVARYLISAGRHIVVEPQPNGDAASVRLFLLGTVFALLCHQRGVLPVHASCMAIDGKAVAFLGEAAMGKSVLAAVLARDGHAILADDVSAVEWAADGTAMVLPGAPRLLLWRRALADLNIAFDSCPRARAGLEKYVLSGPGHPGALSLGVVYELDVSAPPSEPKPIPYATAIRNPHASIHCTLLARHLFGARGLLDAGARFAASAPRYSLAVGRNVAQTATAAQFVIRHLATIT